MTEYETHRPVSLLVWPLRQKCVDCGAERQMAGMFSLTEWQMPDGHIVVDCEVRGEDPRPSHARHNGESPEDTRSVLILVVL